MALYAIAGILVLVILLLMFRVQALIGVLRGSHENKGGLTNKVNAALFMVFFVAGTVLFIWYTMTGDYDNLGEASSEHGVKTDKLFYVTMIIITIVFLFTNFLLFLFSFLYQYKKDRKATFYPENSRLEIVWTVIPAIVLTYLVFNGWKEWTKITDDPAPEVLAAEEYTELEIVGQQFAWSCRYPGADGELGTHYYTRINGWNPFGLKVEDTTGLDDFMPMEIHIPVDRKVKFRIRAKDVLHSVFAPHFRVKMDAVPGMPTKFWFTPTKSTREKRIELSKDPKWQVIDPESGEPKWKNFNYELACTEICGRGHFSMRYIIVVDEQEEYDAWYDSQVAWTANESTRGDIEHYLKLNNPEVAAAVLGKIDSMMPKPEVAEAEEPAPVEEAAPEADEEEATEGGAEMSDDDVDGTEEPNGDEISAL